MGDDSRWAATLARGDYNCASRKGRDSGLTRGLSDWAGCDGSVGRHVDGGGGRREQKSSSAIDAGAGLAVRVRVSWVALIGREARGSSRIPRDVGRGGDQSQVARLRNASSAIWVAMGWIACV